MARHCYNAPRLLGRTTEGAQGFLHDIEESYAAVQSQKAVSAWFTCKQILPFGFAKQYGPNLFTIARNYISKAVQVLLTVCCVCLCFKRVDITYRIKPEELYILSFVKGRGLSLFHS